MRRAFAPETAHDPACPRRRHLPRIRRSCVRPRVLRPGGHAGPGRGRTARCAGRSRRAARREPGASDPGRDLPGHGAGVHQHAAGAERPQQHERRGRAADGRRPPARDAAHGLRGQQEHAGGLHHLPTGLEAQLSAALLPAGLHHGPQRREAARAGHHHHLGLRHPHARGDGHHLHGADRLELPELAAGAGLLVTTSPSSRR